MFINLDCFKEFNDKYGHGTGDQLLIKIAAVLKTNIRSQDIVVRIGGDEFVICLGGNDETDRIGAENVAGKLVKRIGAIKSIQGKAITIGASIGILRTTATDNILSKNYYAVPTALCIRQKMQARANGSSPNIPGYVNLAAVTKQ